MARHSEADQERRGRVKRHLEHAAGDTAAQVRCPICRLPLYVVLTGRGTAWRCGCEELKRRKVAAAA